jgi:diguanylate cyclase (GGDEF)-like protein
MVNEIEISGSIGISVYPKDGEELDTLKANADIAMYHAKKEGRNKFIFFSPEMLTK